MKTLKALIPCLFLLSAPLIAQQTFIEGYVYEENNRGYLKKAKVKLYVQGSDEIINETFTDKNGAFKFNVERGKKYRLTAFKNNFLTKDLETSTIGLKDKNKVFVEFELVRKPGYIFDVTIAELRQGRAIVNAIDSARIEIYNNTTDKEELVLNNFEHPNFKFTFEPGNHYTLMIRRKGFLNKRVEAYIDIDGCILCFDGLGTVEPGVTDVLAYGHDMGTMLANIELQPVSINTTFKIENIYYDYDQYDIRGDAAIELDNLIQVLNDNPTIIVELGSHTDSRGKDTYNKVLSERRASAAVDYLVEQSVDPSRLTSKGYGESILVNHCRNGRKCSDEEHQQNRRTELKIIGFKKIDPLENKSLAEIIREEKLLQEVLSSEQIKIPEENEEVKN